jgi:hypothetical protein
MTVGDDVMLTTKSERAITFHVDDIFYFAFSGHQDGLDGPNKPVARRIVDPVTDSEFCFHL